MDIKKLIEEARKAEKYAYAPYSNFRVGAALLTSSGNIYTGANVENASYGLTICAERTAIVKAVTAGERDFNVICVTSSGKGFVYPCGACLQVLAEFSPHIRVIVTDENDNYCEYLLKDMLPNLFLFDK
ncbi:cytidine deaminase [Thermosyntropha sp.]|uniref:cytidine deaminase n=1 Tax=Thermosyntropha sp. TaxID=2740820 RepID=UPI0025FB1323|nr:cytidine deaminase [Thermosyntropha sp.]MBO8158672.1 cytidine deaminase [Thermosyntropha sp.]